MDDDLKMHCCRFIELMGRWADPDLFTEEDAWAFIEELRDEWARDFVPLSDGQLMALRNLGASLGMKPGTPLAYYGSAVKRAFGRGPMSDADLAIVTRYMYGQVNGGGDFEPARRPKVTLSVPPVGERAHEVKKR